MRFYADYSTPKAKRAGGDAPNALVIWDENGRFISSGAVCYEGRAAIFDTSNSPLATTGIALKYLRSACKRIRRAEAFRIHPVMKREFEEDVT